MLDMDVLTDEQRHINMLHIRAKDTTPELLLRKALWHSGIRYRKNYKTLPGTPDIVITKRKIAIFVDGDFWHAKGHQDNPGEQIKSNREFWVKKLSRNVERDKEVDEELLNLGWLVLRFWESDIKRDVERCAKLINEYI